MREGGAGRAAVKRYDEHKDETNLRFNDEEGINKRKSTSSEEY